MQIQLLTSETRQALTPKEAVDAILNPIEGGLSLEEKIDRMEQFPELQKVLSFVFLENHNESLLRLAQKELIWLLNAIVRQQDNIPARIEKLLTSYKTQPESFKFGDEFSDEESELFSGMLKTLLVFMESVRLEVDQNTKVKGGTGALKILKTA